jgi:hypothetical protein
MGRRSKKKKSWSDLSPAQQKATIAAGTVQVSLCIAALVDIRRRPAEQINGKKPMWVGLAFVNTLGPLAYFIFGRKR